jgi:hypothetical protein
MMDSTNRLLLHALLIRLGEAVGGNDEAAVDRYHRRVGLIAHQHFPTNPQISNALEELLAVSSEWLATNVAERFRVGQRLLEHIDRVGQLL